MSCRRLEAHLAPRGIFTGGPWENLANPCFFIVGSVTRGAAGRGAEQVDQGFLWFPGTPYKPCKNVLPCNPGQLGETPNFTATSSGLGSNPKQQWAN